MPDKHAHSSEQKTQYTMKKGYAMTYEHSKDAYIQTVCLVSADFHMRLML